MSLEMLSTENFEEKTKSGTVLVDMYADWCSPCRMMAPVLDQVATEQSGKLEVTKIDVDAHPDVMNQFGVRSIPTMLLFKNGKLVERVVGFQSKQKLMNTIGPWIG